MINVTSLNGQNNFYVNIDKIETVESTPDTMITLDSGRKFLVSESAFEVVQMVEDGKRRVRNLFAD